MKLPSPISNALVALQSTMNFSSNKFNKGVSWVCVFACLVFAVGANSQEVNRAALNDTYPDRYTVVKGDTLWGISSKFLRDAWRWPEIWQGNPEVENPDLIYPGDVLVLTWVDGRPVLRSLRRQTVKLSPEARPLSYGDAIPLIDPAAINAYINAPLVTDEEEMETAGYIVNGFDNRLVFGKGDQYYARGVEADTKPGDNYKIFRPGRHFVNPETKESLGYEAIHVGDSLLMKEGDPVRMEITTSFNDVNIRDRLRLVPEIEAMPFFSPKAPNDIDVRGVILETQNEATELGALSVIAISVGEREGIEAGNVLRIRSQKYKKKDPVKNEIYFIPEENVGLALVFRTFEKVSYAIITDTNQHVRPGDVLVHPNAE